MLPTKIFTRTDPWYAGGLAFECVQSGRCCAGPQEGYVWVTPGEIDRLAEFLHLPGEQVRTRYTRPVGKRVSLKEDLATKDCVFLVRQADGQTRCAVYPARPTQCRTWPFWPINLFSADAWGLAELRCPGINRGTVHPPDEIQEERDRTNC
jgi:Fe-S-cluster containining protein